MRWHVPAQQSGWQGESLPYGGFVRRYVTERNERWVGFEHRPGDVVISTRSKCGTTWLQMIGSMLVFGEAKLPRPLSEISPWLDWDVEPIGVVRRRLAAQEHRRVIKTHTPLDGLPLDDRVRYIVAGRRPLDVAVSQYHHSRNIDRVRFAELTGRPAEQSPDEPFGEWVQGWIFDDWESRGRLDSLSGLVHHLNDAWVTRPGINVRLVHFDDLVADLDTQVRSLAAWLGIEVDEAVQKSLVDAATFSSMRSRSEWAVPDRLGVLASRDAFFRGGRVGDGIRSATPEQVSATRERVADLAIPDVARWLLRTESQAEGSVAPSGDD